MPSMLVLQSARVAAHWNNQATLLIQQRDYSKAAATLTTALINLKEGLNTTTTPCSGSSSSSSSIRVAPTSTTSSRSNMTSSFYSSFEPVEEEDDVMVAMETSASSSSSSSSSSTPCLLTFLSTGKTEQDPQATFDNVSSSSSSSSNTTASSSVQQRMMAVTLDDDDMYLYHPPVQVTSAKALISSPLCVEIVSYAIIYNLALCHHLAALLFVKEGTSTSTTVSTASSSSLSLRTMQLQRAVSFYQQAQRLACAHSLTCCYMDILHMLVLVNNMGHAHYCLDKKSTMAKYCFQQLWNTILDHPTFLMSTSTTHELNHPDESSGLVQCFLLNVVHYLIWGVGTCVAAPAA